MSLLQLDGYSKSLFAISAAAIAAFVTYFTLLAKPRPGDRLTRRWQTSASESPGREPAAPCRFVDVTRSCGVRFVHASGPRVRDIRDVIGAGVAVEDLNQDQALDLLFVNGGEGGAHHELYLNQGSGTFTLAPPSCGLYEPQFGMGCVAGDLNDDGRIDLVVTGIDDTRLYLNGGNDAAGCPAFRNVAREAGLDVHGFATAAALNDLDQDGDLDLVIVRYLTFEAHPDQLPDPRNEPSEFVPRSFAGETDLLLVNDGAGADGVPHFTEMKDSPVAQDPLGKGLGVLFADLDLDRKPEIYVANDVSANKLYVNCGGGVMTPAQMLAGSLVDDARSGMGLELGDVDGDGRPDLFATYWQDEESALYHNQLNELSTGCDLKATFFDEAILWGLAAPSIRHVKWGAVLADLDLDGLLDVVVGNGYTSPSRDDQERKTCVPQLPQLFFGTRRGERPWFAPASPQAGEFLGVPLNARGVAAGDLDGDGDLDLVITQNQGPALVLRNDTARGRSWLKVRLHAGRGERHSPPGGIGAEVVVHAAGRELHRWVLAGESYLSHSSLEVEVGLLDAPRVDGIDVIWPSGKHTAVGATSARQVIDVEEP